MNPSVFDFVRVPEGFEMEYKNGVYSIMRNEFKTQLDGFLHQYQNTVLTRNRLSSDQITKFPFVDFSPYTADIFTRRQDLHFLNRLCFSRARHLKVLDVGSWNCWLSHWIYTMGHQVVSIDIFRDEIDGLESKNHFKDNGWLAVQADLRNPEIFSEKFDMVVINHCIQFMPDSKKLLGKYFNLLAPDGQLVILGVDYRKDQERQRRRVEHYTSAFLKKQGFDLFFYSAPGFVNVDLMCHLKEGNFTFEPYRVSFFKTLMNALKGDRCGIFYLQKSL